MSEKTPNTISPDKIGAGRQRTQAKSAPDRADRLENAAATKAEAEAEALIEENRDKRALRKLRFQYAKHVYWFLIWYCTGALSIVLLDGFKVGGFDVQDTALTVIVGSTAVSAIGLVGFVVNGLFSSR